MDWILLVEGHARLAASIQRALEKAGLTVDIVESAESAWTASREMIYGVMVVDRVLPDGDGLALVRRYRDAGIRTPCLILTASDAPHDRIHGLEGGADDHLTRPFVMDELVARVRALLRRPAGQKTPAPDFGDLWVCPDAGVMSCGDESVALSATEMQLMLAFVRGAGEVVRRHQLDSAPCELSDAVTPDALDVALHHLRRKLQAIGSRQRIVKVRTVAYALRETSLGE